MSIESLTCLDAIPDNLYHRLVTHRYRAKSALTLTHSLQQRVQGVLDLRLSLINGEAGTLSALYEWQDHSIAECVYNKLNDNDLLSNTRNNSVYADEVILNVLNWLDSIDDTVGSKNTENYSQNSAVNQDAFKHTNHSPTANLNSVINDVVSIPGDDKLRSGIDSINKGFALQKKLGWDLTRGIESKTDLKALLSYYEVVQKSRRIQSVVNMIGRNKVVSVDKQNTAGVNQIDSNNTSYVLPDEHSVNSVSGVCLGDDVSKMLPSELVMLGNNKLKMLWHAKRAERQLLSYHFQGLLSEHVPELQANSIDYNRHSNTLTTTSGPMILCVDTSASMKGQPELISKAITLEAMRIAHLQKRHCFLFFFGSTDELIQLDLNLKYQADEKMNQGWNTVISFLRLSFNGGTDVNNVLSQAIIKLKSRRWSNADILLISDGLFKLDASLILKLKNNKNINQIFGIQTAKWGSKSLSDICHIVFDFSDV